MFDYTAIKQAKLNIIANLFNSNSILFSIIRTTFRIIVNDMKYCKITIINHPLISYHITNISSCIYAVGFYCFFHFNAYMVPSNDNFHDIKKEFSIPTSIFKTCYHIPTAQSKHIVRIIVFALFCNIFKTEIASVNQSTNIPVLQIFAPSNENFLFGMRNKF